MVESGSVHPQTTTRLIPTGIYSVKYPLTMRVSAYSRRCVKPSNFHRQWGILTRNLATLRRAGQPLLSSLCCTSSLVHFTGTIISLSLMYIGITKPRRDRIAIGKPIDMPLSAVRISTRSAVTEQKWYRIGANPQLPHYPAKWHCLGGTGFRVVAPDCAALNVPHRPILQLTRRISAPSDASFCSSFS